MSLQEIRRTVPGVVASTVEYLPVVTSTNDYLWNLAHLQPGHLVLTDAQTSGRGRGSHRWDAQEAMNLLFSFYLVSPTTNNLLTLLPITTAVAICTAIDPTGDKLIKAKWPNDIVHRGKKLGGILIESRVSAETARIVVGIGLNVNQLEFGKEFDATSLALIAGHSFARDVLLGRIVDELNRWLTDLASAETISIYRARCITIGQYVQFENAGQTCSGRAVGVDDLGRLLIEEAGSTHVYSGSEVTHLRLRD